MDTRIKLLISSLTQIQDKHCAGNDIFQRMYPYGPTHFLPDSIKIIQDGRPYVATAQYRINGNNGKPLQIVSRQRW